MEEQSGVSIHPIEHTHPLRVWEYDSPPKNLYFFIVDPLCHKDVSSTLFRQRGSRLPVPLFAGGPLENSLAVSPWIAEIDNENDEFAAWIETISPPGWGMFCSSYYDWPTVLSHLQSLVLAKEEVPDGKKIVFRFWDNRVFMRIAKGIPSSCSILMGPLASIVSQDETGKWFNVINHYKTYKPADAQKTWYVFDDAHISLFSDTVDKIIAYNVSEKIYSYMDSEDIPLPRDESLTNYVQRQIENVKPLNINDEDALASYVCYALYNGEDTAFNIVSRLKGKDTTILRGLWKHCSPGKS